MLTNAATRFVGSPRLNSKVEAWVIKQQDGSLLAEEIRLVSAPEPTAEPLQFTAPLLRKSGTVWTIGSYQVEVPASATISGQPAIGDFIQVSALKYSNGQIHARSLKVLDQPEVMLQGYVETFSATMWRVAGRNVYIDKLTVTYGEVRVGRMAQIGAIQSPDGRLMARTIYVYAPTPTPTSKPTGTATVTPTATRADQPPETPTPPPTATLTPTPSRTPPPTPKPPVPRATLEADILLTPEP